MHGLYTAAFDAAKNPAFVDMFGNSVKGHDYYETLNLKGVV